MGMLCLSSDEPSVVSVLGEFTSSVLMSALTSRMLSSTAPVYVSEIAPPNIRGALLVIEEFMIVLGIVVMYYVRHRHSL